MPRRMDKEKSFSTGIPADAGGEKNSNKQFRFSVDVVIVSGPRYEDPSVFTRLGRGHRMSRETRNEENKNNSMVK